MWWHKNPIPISESNFQKIIDGLVFECPSSIKGTIADGANNDGKAKRKAIYKPVSVRNSTFRERGVTGNQLTTVLAQIRKPLVKSNTYAVIEINSAVDGVVQNIIRTSSASDSLFELLVYQSRPDMSDTEAIYYYIRNAFAHGSFEVINQAGRRTYLLESQKNGTIKAQMRLREETLLYYIDLSNMNTAEIKALQKSKKKLNKRV